MKKFFQLLLAIIVCQTAGAIGALFTTPAIPGWYTSLNKPFFNPPSFIFGPVWLTLYTTMGISLYLLWQNRSKNKLANSTIVLFIIHLVVNSLWSIIFFGGQQILLALFDIILLFILIVILIWQSWQIKKMAAYLLIPYLVWVSFATILNASIWFLNK